MGSDRRGRAAPSFDGGRDVVIGRAVSVRLVQMGRDAQALSGPGGREAPWAQKRKEIHTIPLGSALVIFFGTGVGG